jgi:hypothetical protein
MCVLYSRFAFIYTVDEKYVVMDHINSCFPQGNKTSETVFQYAPSIFPEAVYAAYISEPQTVASLSMHNDL